VERQPDNLDAHRWLSAIYVDLNAGIRATTHLREWIRLDPEDPRPYRWFCLINREIEEGYPEAIQGYRKLLQLGLEPGERAAVLKDLAETQIALADYSHALETLAQTPEAFQNQPAILLLRAECLQGLGNGNEARIIVDGVLKEHPSLAKALLFRAKIYVQENQPRSAIALLEKLVSRHPDHSQARQSLMIAYRRVGDDRRAAEQKQIMDLLQALRSRLMQLKPVVAKNPWDGHARLEAALLNSGANYSEALAWIRFALASSPDDPRVRKTWTQLVGYQPPPLLRDFQRRHQRKADNQ
jgi:tetratricopeptide (TPR) repeat protein